MGILDFIAKIQKKIPVKIKNFTGGIYYGKQSYDFRQLQNL